MVNSKKHYKIKEIDLFNLSIQDLLKSKLSETTVSEIMSYLEQESISFEYKKFYVQIADGKISYYWDGTLAYQNNTHLSSAIVTNYIKKKFAEDKLSELICGIDNEIITALYLIYGHEKSAFNEKQFNSIFSTVYKIKKMPLSPELHYYNNTTMPYVIKKQTKDKIHILLNTMYRINYTIPSTQYPMPEKGNLRYFYKENSPILNDNGELDIILKGHHGELGKCFKNTADAIDILTSSGYNKIHKVEYFAGWLFSNLSKPVFHAWVVVDEESVIDINIFNEVTNNILYDEIISGEKVLDREKLAYKIKQINADHSSLYSQYYNYGDCGNYLYVGLPTTREKAADLMKQIINDPKIKDYDNVNKTTGENKLQEIYKSL